MKYYQIGAVEDIETKDEAEDVASRHPYSIIRENYNGSFRVVQLSMVPMYLNQFAFVMTEDEEKLFTKPTTTTIVSCVGIKITDARKAYGLLRNRSILSKIDTVDDIVTLNVLVPTIMTAMQLVRQLKTLVDYDPARKRWQDARFKVNGNDIQ